MAVLKGQNGVVKVGGVPVANVTSFSISEEADMLETTSLATSASGAQGRTYVPGLRQITGTIDCNLDTSAHASFEVGDTVTIVLELDGSASNHITGNVIITNSSIEVTPDALITASFDFQTNDSAGYTKGILGNLDETD